MSSEPRSFITTFWCGPPLAEFDDQRAAEIAAAGFTVVGPPCEGGTDSERNRQALAIAARHSLQLWIADARFDERATTRPNWAQAISEAAGDYKDLAGFGGYFVTDEPGPQQFDDLAVIVARLREVDPQHPIYLNLLADYVGFEPGSYRNYVDRFITTVRPSLVSYDYYPFLLARDRPTFFNNLALIREFAERHNLPFMLIFLAMPHGLYRDPTEAELSWQAFHALAFGARGISYFAYWTPVNVMYADVQKFRHGLIELGKPTEHYFQAMRLNRSIRAMAAEIATFQSVAVSDSVGEIAAAPPIGPIASISGGPVTAGLFGDAAGRRAMVLVNRDYRHPITITLKPLPGEQLPERFNPETSMWVETSDRKLSLTPGGGQLVRWSAKGRTTAQPIAPTEQIQAPGSEEVRRSGLLPGSTPKYNPHLGR